MKGLQWGGVILIFLAIFENGHIAVDWLYFYEFSFNKSANFSAESTKTRIFFEFAKVTCLKKADGNELSFYDFARI